MATFERHVDVDWTGSVMEGKGEAKAGTGAFSLPVTFPARIGEPDGKTSPEELMAAAHAACYAMALNGTLGRKQASADRTVVRATVTADKGDAGIKIMSSKLDGDRVRPEGARRGAVRRGREGSRRPLPGVERLSRDDADHGRRESRVSQVGQAGRVGRVGTSTLSRSRPSKQSHGRSHSRCAVRVSEHPEIAGVRPRHRSDAGARRRCQHGHLLGRQCGDSAAARVPPA